MTRRIAASCSLVVAATLGPVSAEPVAVPVGVRIPVSLAAAVTSRTAHVGDPFAFKTTREVRLGDVIVPAGSPGAGRIAAVMPAHDRERGSMSLLTDAIELPGGRSISVNVDPATPLRGHYADRHTHVKLLFFIVALVPVSKTTLDGDLVLDAGTSFDVTSAQPRTVPAAIPSATPSAMPSAAPSTRPSPAG
ncbi:MAG: hypothetical protein NVS2B3_03520 [Vulcanimicrobiaceae bacterium]